MRLVTWPLMVIVVLFFCLNGFGMPGRVEKSYSIGNITAEEGLAANSVYDIIQDHVGFIWFATSDGLSRYDGYEFVTYKGETQQTPGLSHPFTMSVCEDSQGYIWIGTAGSGLNRLNPETQEIVHYEYNQDDPCSLSNDVIFSLFEDSQERLWIGTWRGGLCRYDRENDAFIRINELEGSGYAGLMITSFMEDHEGRLWVTSFDSGVSILEPGAEEWVTFRHSPEEPASVSSDRLFSSCQTSDGTIWIGAAGGIVNRLLPDSNSFERIQLGDSITASVRSLTQSDDDHLWISTYKDGIVAFNMRTRDVRRLPYVEEGPGGISSDKILVSFKDSSGVIWIGTENGGINFCRQHKSFHSVPLVRDPEIGENSTKVMSLLKSDDRTLLAGTFGGGIKEIDLITGEEREYRAGAGTGNTLSDDIVLSILPDSKGLIWIGCGDGSLNSFDPRNGQFRHYSMDHNLSSRMGQANISCLYISRDDTIYIGSALNGLYSFDRESETFSNVPVTAGIENYRIEDNWVMCVTENSEGVLWIGSLGSGLFTYNPRTGESRHIMHDPTEENGLPGNDINELFIDETGALWIGSDGYGLTKYDPAAGTFTTYTEQDGLANNTIYRIFKDNSGYLWISTYNGLNRFDPRTETFLSFDKSDGLMTGQFTTGGGYISPEGRIYFGTIKGYISFIPDEIRLNSTPPQVRITSMLLFNRPVRAGSGPDKNRILDKNIAYSDSIRLTHEQNFVTFKFSALDFNNSAKNSYAYKMDNLFEDWIELGNRRVVDLNLMPGTYVLRVKASNSDGIWAESERVLNIYVAPAFYETFWFRSIIGVVLLVVIIAFVRIRYLAAVRHEALLEAQVNERTSELRDEVDAHSKTTQVLQTHRDELLEANQELEAFAYMVSHDLRTAVFQVQGYGEILRDLKNSDSQDSDKYFEKLFSSCAKMDVIIKGLLRLSKASRSSLRREYVNLSAYASRVIEDLQQAEPDLGVKFEIEKNLRADCDPDLMLIVLENLINNASKFSAGQESPVVTFGMKSIDGRDVFYVQDNGIGFDPAGKECLFQPFKRLHTNPEYLGTGIGLATVKRIIDRHGGEIWGESDGKNGAVFYFTTGEQSTGDEEKID